MTRPRAADDFPMIRARMEELRRERAAPAGDDTRRPDGPRPYAISDQPGPADRPSGITPMMRRALQKVIPTLGRRASLSTC